VNASGLRAKELHERTRIAAIAPTRSTSGAAIYSRKLYSRLPAEIIPGEKPALLVLRNAFGHRVDAYHIQFEYRGFGGFAKSLISLVLLASILSLKRPVVLTFHGIVTPDGLQGRKLKKIVMLAYLASYKLAAHFSSLVVVHSAAMRSALGNHYGITKTVVVPIGTDPARSDVQKSSNPSNLVFYGFVRPGKGVENIILALKQIKRPDTQLVICGGLARGEEAGYLAHLERSVTENSLDGQVKFINRSMTELEKLAYFSEALALVLPYTDRFVEASAVVHDFAGFATPIICSRTPRFAELIDGYDCIKVEPTPAQIAKAITVLQNDKALWTSLANNLLRKTTEESWEEVAKKHLEIYRSVIISQIRNDGS